MKCKNTQHQLQSRDPDDKAAMGEDLYVGRATSWQQTFTAETKRAQIFDATIMTLDEVGYIHASMTIVQTNSKKLEKSSFYCFYVGKFVSVKNAQISLHCMIPNHNKNPADRIGEFSRALQHLIIIFEVSLDRGMDG